MAISLSELPLRLRDDHTVGIDCAFGATFEGILYGNSDDTVNHQRFGHL